MRIAYLGNFGAHNTESEIAKAVEANGWECVPFQEGEQDRMAALIDTVAEFDAVWWTRTKSLADRTGDALAWKLLTIAERAGVPTVGVHLDRWIGLSREPEIAVSPFFRCSTVFTADGGHAAEWKSYGVNHVWMPPAVSEFECVPGTPRDEYRAEIAFVGSEDYGHKEWTHRGEMIQFLRDTYGGRFRTFPGIGQPAVRGDSLRDLYASVGVVVGDSCLVPNGDGSPARSYWSDRVPETLGRGGFLIHPWVQGIEVEHPGLPTWRLGEWGALRTIVDWWLDNPEERVRVAAENRDHILDRHIYTVRVRAIAQTLGLA